MGVARETREERRARQKCARVPNTTHNPQRSARILARARANCQRNCPPLSQVPTIPSGSACSARTRSNQSQTIANNSTVSGKKQKIEALKARACTDTQDKNKKGGPRATPHHPGLRPGGDALGTPKPQGAPRRTTVGIPMKVRVRKYHGQSTEIATLGCSGPRAARFLAHDRRGEAPYSGAQAHGRRGTPSGHRRLSGRGALGPPGEPPQ